ncbi:hypothetical protein E2C01_080320 [Portunus trituberculatus]|uniref:Uncharacterized protein n=1 Tax=Portunus trituberculatus TaxID=210409 RepID=A0A5B7ITS7_PORTR|nr:hypothetical protein [Portunus trituberculatus]
MHHKPISLSLLLQKRTSAMTMNFNDFDKSNGITLKNTVKLACVKIKISDTDHICFGSYNV